MEKPTQLIDRAAQVRQGMIAFVDTLNAQATALELPKPPAALQRSRDKLAENAYTVLVVGEAKRGKSSFINALIGRELLPTDVDIATSQVFRVQPAEQEAYRVRFEDGSAQSITAGDLPRYGSQVVADVQGTPRLDQLIRWIEVDIPIRFLPPGVTLLDTPGMGSLYAAHTQITQRFVPHADAVIYVLDSSQPLGQPDLDFIEQLLGVTPNLFFIQTKIDQYRKDAWQQIQQRNQALLAEHFGDRLPSTHVWPISNQNLLKAAQTGDEDYLAVSRQGELSEALQAFLFRVAGWFRAAQTATIADTYFGQARQTLAGRLAALSVTTLERRANWQEQSTRRLQQFEAEWGIQGTQRQALLARVQQIVTEGRRSFEEALAPSGPVELALTQKVDALMSLEDAEKLADALPVVMAADVNKRWQQMCDFCTVQTAQVVAPFIVAAEALMVPHEELPVGDSAGPRPRIKSSWLDKFVAAGKTSWDTSNNIIVLIIEEIDYRAGFVARLSATIFGFVRGWQLSKKKQLLEAQRTLRVCVGEDVARVRTYFLSADLGTGRRCLMEEYVETLTQAVAQSVGTIAANKQAEAQAEADRLAAQANLDDQARHAHAEQAQRDMAAWDQVGQTLVGLVDELDALDKATAPVA